MPQSQTLTGARVQLYVPNQTGTLVLAGIYDTVSKNVSLGTEGVWTLGQYSAHEIPITSYELVTLNCSGFRVLDHGVTIIGNFPTLADLLNFNSVVLKVVDRQSGKTTMVVTGAVPNANSENYNVKATSKISISYVGIAAFSENETDASGNPTDGEGTPSWP
jgi:hypothetical protein